MTETIIDEMSPEQLATVVELQRVALDRLLSDQRRLNDRIDMLLQLQEREQVLRQQMQASLDRLAEQRSGAPVPNIAPDNVPAADHVPRLTDRLNRAERRYNSLRTAVVQLVNALERPRPGPNGGHVKVFAPGAPEV